MRSCAQAKVKAIAGLVALGTTRTQLELVNHSKTEDAGGSGGGGGGGGGGDEEGGKSRRAKNEDTPEKKLLKARVATVEVRLIDIIG